jgi:hypothetical protein
MGSLKLKTKYNFFYLGIYLYFKTIVAGMRLNKKLSCWTMVGKNVNDLTYTIHDRIFEFRILLKEQF